MRKIRCGFAEPACKTPLHYPGAAHVSVIAPTRAGKFRDVVAQILLSYTGSCFVIDPKGQAAAVTARYRREVLNQEVAVINPFNIFSSDYLAHVQHAQYNPLKSNLDPDDESYAADADNMAEGLLPYGGPDTHWIDSARLLVSGICQTCRLVSDDASLVDVFRTISGRGIFQYCKDIIAADPTGFVAERLERFAVRTKENRSIVSAAITGLSFIGNTPIARSLSASTVDLAAMTKRPMTVYAILPGRPARTKQFEVVPSAVQFVCRCESSRGYEGRPCPRHPRRIQGHGGVFEHHQHLDGYGGGVRNPGDADIAQHHSNSGAVPEKLGVVSVRLRLHHGVPAARFYDFGVFFENGGHHGSAHHVALDQ